MTESPQAVPRSIHHIAAGTSPRVPWKNGRGVTVEFAVWPVGATLGGGDFHWRLSQAAVDEAGPFSKFAGYDRILTVIHGTGLELRHAGSAAPAHPADVLPLQPYAFSGGWDTSAELLDGRIDDFNVVFRPEAYEADVTVHRGPWQFQAKSGGHDAADTAHHLFAHVIAGDAEIAIDDRVLKVTAGDSVWVRGARRKESLGIDAPSNAVVLVVALGARSSRQRHQ